MSKLKIRIRGYEELNIRLNIVKCIIIASFNIVGPHGTPIRVPMAYVSDAS